jgi:hypothetical protein
VGGCKLSNTESLDPVDPIQFFQLKALLAEAPGDDFWNKVGRWFFTTVNARTVSPKSDLIIPLSGREASTNATIENSNAQPSAPVTSDIGAPLTLLAQKLEEDFGDGFDILKFGLTPEEIVPSHKERFKWELLPVAGEYKRAEVRYLIWDMAGFPATKTFGHPSAQSYICALFKEGRLFCVSLRFMDDYDVPDHTFILKNFLAKYNLEKIGSQTYLYQENHLLVIAERGSGYTVIEICDNPSLHDHTFPH